MQSNTHIDLNLIKKFIKSSATIIFLGTWLALFLSGFVSYTESKIIYTLFSLVYLAVLLSGFIRATTYGYLFLAIFMWLGFWLKLTLHSVFNYPYVEPIGSFYSSHASMDDVLMVAMVGAIGVLCANLLYRVFKIKPTVFVKPNRVSVPIIFDLYFRYKNTILLITIFLVALVSFLNHYYAIQLCGVVPKTILVYPLNALISWMLGIGFSLLIATFISWDIRFGEKIDFTVLYIYILALGITSIALLSRGQYIFLVGALLVFLMINQQLLTKKSDLFRIALLLMIAAAIYIIVIFSVTILREGYFTGLSFTTITPLQGYFTGLSSTTMTPLRGIYSTFTGLISDRWIGMEGVMALVSYPDKSFDLFFNSLTSHPQIGQIDIYQYIANSYYKDMDNTKYTFATLPGFIAYLYYTGSLFFVLIGSFLLASLLLFLEYLVKYTMNSALFASIIGMMLANSIAQLGLSPINLLKSLFLIVIFFFLVKFLKSNYFSMILKNTLNHD